jgi:ribosomal RNA-processing protein 36
MKKSYQEEYDEEEFDSQEEYDEDEEIVEEDDDEDIENDDYDSEEEIIEEDSDEDDDNERDQQIENLEKELSKIPFNQIAKIQQKMGMKEFNKTFAKTSNKSNIIKDEAIKKAKESLKLLKKKKEQKPIKKRENKNRPMEISSKKPVSRYREVIEVKKKKTRDPRFDNLSGKYNEDLFKKSYKFLSEIEENEMNMIQEKIKKTKNSLEKEKLTRVYQSLKSKKQTEAAKERRQAIKREWRKKEMQRVKEGKRPYFLKKADLKRMELIDKYKNTKSKSIDKILEKRRKKNASKEHKLMPRKRTE